MFTGLVEEVSPILAIQVRGDGYGMELKSQLVIQDLKIGDSVSVNGICLTVVRQTENSFFVEAVSETVSRTTLKSFRTGQKVNLERALMAQSRLGGHFVQGHIDGVAQVARIEDQKPGFLLTLRMPNDLSRYCVEKGSIAIDGVSLTIAQVLQHHVSIALIPHTAKSTTLGQLVVGDRVNIEVDIIAKYVEKFSKSRDSSNSVTWQKLTEMGYE